jgi:type I restriction enzyme M protein
MGHQDVISFIWNIANLLRGPYRPPQYRRVMLPMIVLRRLDSVISDKKPEMLELYTQLKAQKKSDIEIEKLMTAKYNALYNTSKFDFESLLADADNISSNLINYIQGFSLDIKDIFIEKFKFNDEIVQMNKHNMLYKVVKEFAKVDLGLKEVDNIQMGLAFEELVRKFNEQANEEAGDHFTPRDAINLMATLLFTIHDDSDEKETAIYKSDIVRTIYDPTCGTGGMLTEGEKLIKEQNSKARVFLFGQEYNEESFAICRSDMLIKGENAENIVYGDTLGDGKTFDGYPNRQFHYMMANPPFGVEWKLEEDIVKNEHSKQGFGGRFGAGLPRISDGSLLFLLHMMSKMYPSPAEGGDGSKIGIVFNGSPLFTGDAGSGESNIRRWIIENDMLEAVVALPVDMFYNTGIATYIWIVTNRKVNRRKGKVQLVDGRQHFQKMRKSLGNKRNELTETHIKEITRLYCDFKHDDISNGAICSKIFDNSDFGYIKITVERPLRLNFQASKERINKIYDETVFKNLAISKKKNEAEKKADENAGRELQERIIDAISTLDGAILYKDKAKFEPVMEKALKELKLAKAVKTAIYNAFSERDPEAEIVYDKGKAVTDTDLRDYENIPLPSGTTLPLPIGYEKDADPDKINKLLKEAIKAYFDREVKSNLPDAWIDYSKTKIGYEIPLTKHFYVYTPPRELSEIEAEMRTLEKEIIDLLGGTI